MAYYSDNFKDLFDSKIVVDWTKKLWEEHSEKHQLSDFTYTSNLIRDALKNPSIVLGGFRKMKGGKKQYIMCYYKEHKPKNSIATEYTEIDHTKVVVGSESRTNFVKTVWRKKAFKNFILQEKKYNFTEIWKNQNCSL
ncbi:hypothetical protein KJ885_04885 [Patescibacteria group bacterium]|nr:hypothetical protein [Patescibacteria group bacterium]